MYGRSVPRLRLAGARATPLVEVDPHGSFPPSPDQGRVYGCPFHGKPLMSFSAFERLMAACEWALAFFLKNEGDSDCPRRRHRCFYHRGLYERPWDCFFFNRTTVN